MSMSCKGCTKRYIGCHAECEDYKKFRAEKDEKNAERYRRRKANQDRYAIMRKTSVIKRCKDFNQ